MAQIAIPLLLLGTAYLVSNDDSNNENSENFSNINDVNSDLLANEYKEVSPNEESVPLNMNNSGNYNSYQDKYFLKKQDTPDEKFQSLTGETMTYDQIEHNNMTAFFSNKTNGSLTDYNQKSILDNYTGSGTYDIEKNEVAQLFKPQENTQNVYGTQNQNDFLQSRVNQSLRHANSKPWQEVQVGPGLNQGYDAQTTALGFNSGMESRDMWQPKTVDELRAANNPKVAYRLDNHMGPAATSKGLQQSSTVDNLGKIQKKSVDTYYVNNGQFTRGAQSQNLAHTQKPMQMMTKENRDTTSVEYYGVKGSQNSESQYTRGQHKESSKIQLPTKPFLNMTNSNIYPTSKQNYGKEGFKSYANNRTTTRDSYIGNVFGQLKANVIDPVMDGFKHTKKGNFVKNSHNGHMNGTSKKPIVYNPNEYAPTTNREMYEEKLNMNHLNVQQQDATGYMSSNPYLIGTQRASMNQTETGPAMGVNQQFSKNYESVYNQRNNDNRLNYSRTNTGNMSIFNNQTNVAITGHEKCNNRTNALYNPSANSNLMDTPGQQLGMISSGPQEYDNIQKDYNSPDLLKAFKNNPYTQPLGSVA